MKTSNENNSENQTIHVKFLSKLDSNIWLRQFPASTPQWDNCIFIFDPDCKKYDWLVVYEDLPRSKDERFPINEEILSCPRENTMYLTMEPSTIKTYGHHYTSQFEYVVTSQEEWALPHPNRIQLPPNLPWFYGLSHKKMITYDMMKAAETPNKTKLLSTVCSVKKQKNTVHYKRYQFTHDLKRLIPELEIFGRGIREINDKAESLDEYKYHIVIENYIGMNHCSEKLSDAFLGHTLPFYYGCPNAAEYFPPESFIEIDINDLEGSRKIILDAIKNDEFTKRLPFIKEARRRVLDEYNIFSVISREINKRHKSVIKTGKPYTLRSRRALRKKYPHVAIMDMINKIKNRIRTKFN
jgi:hypothetical protein